MKIFQNFTEIMGKFRGYRRLKVKKKPKFLELYQNHDESTSELWFPPIFVGYVETSFKKMKISQKSDWNDVEVWGTTFQLAPTWVFFGKIS